MNILLAHLAILALASAAALPAIDAEELRRGNLLLHVATHAAAAPSSAHHTPLPVPTAVHQVTSLGLPPTPTSLTAPSDLLPQSHASAAPSDLHPQGPYSLASAAAPTETPAASGHHYTETTPTTPIATGGHRVPLSHDNDDNDTVPDNWDPLPAKPPAPAAGKEHKGGHGDSSPSKPDDTPAGAGPEGGKHRAGAPGAAEAEHKPFAGAHGHAMNSQDHPSSSPSSCSDSFLSRLLAVSGVNPCREVS